MAGRRGEQGRCLRFLLFPRANHGGSTAYGGGSYLFLSYLFLFCIAVFLHTFAWDPLFVAVCSICLFVYGFFCG